MSAYVVLIRDWSSDVCSSDLTLAVPSFSYLVAKSRVKAAAIDLEIALVRARSEAVKRNSNVTLTPNTGGWKYGWTLLASDGSTLDHGEAMDGINFVSAPRSEEHTSELQSLMRISYAVFCLKKKRTKKHKKTQTKTSTSIVT